MPEAAGNPVIVKAWIFRPCEKLENREAVESNTCIIDEESTLNEKSPVVMDLVCTCKAAPVFGTLLTFSRISWEEETTIA